MGIIHNFVERFASRYDAGDLSVKEDIIKFAAGKLLNADPSIQEFSTHQQLACLSQRLPIEFNSTTWITQQDEKKQVEGHLRVCLKIDQNFESMVTVTPSEPLLSEGAYFIMQRPSFNAPEAMKSVLDGFSIHKGDRGELLALLLLILARDNAIGPADQNGRPLGHRYFDLASFICGKLFVEPLPITHSDSDSISALERIKTDFPMAKAHFSHFIKLHEHKVVNKECLLVMASRGAAALCPNNHVGIDAVTPFLRSGIILSLENMGVILYQFKNDPDYNDKAKPHLFDNMDCFEVGILKPGEQPIPVIRIILALAARTPKLIVTRHPPSADYNAVIYDIWCAGLAPEILCPINGMQAGLWDSLLRASHDWKMIYKTDLESQLLRRTMNPMTACDTSHWCRFYDLADRECMCK